MYDIYFQEWVDHNSVWTEDDSFRDLDRAVAHAVKLAKDEETQVRIYDHGVTVPIRSFYGRYGRPVATPVSMNTHSSALGKTSHPASAPCEFCSFGKVAS